MRSPRPLQTLGAIVALGAILTPRSGSTAPGQPSHTSSAAGHDTFARLVERERAPARFLATAMLEHEVTSLPQTLPALSTLDCEHAVHDIQVDPRSGATVAQLALRVRASGGALSSVGLSFDEGLAIGDVTAEGRAVVTRESVTSPARILKITLSPPLEAGESTVVHVPYQGTLTCGTYPEGGGVLCARGQDFSYFAHQSLIPYLFDPAAPRGEALDAMTHEIILHVPSELDVVATGQKIRESIEGGTKTSIWAIDHPLSRSLGMYVFAGKLGMKPVPGRSVPTTFVFPNPELPADGRLVSWSAGVLDFVEGMGGGALPFQRSLTLVRLPANLGDPGTATFGMTLLSESYARAGDRVHEETWAHENSHLFWGIVVPEASSRESRVMSEGLATLAQIDYSWARHFASIDRDTYLAQRFRPIGLDLRALGKELPPIMLGAGDAEPSNYRTSLYTLWAYYKTSATLDHLRVTVGDEAFGRGLAGYVKRCSYVGCRPDDLRKVLEETTGKDLTSFFDRWVTASSRPAVSLSFEVVTGGAVVELSKADAAPMTLELWLHLDDGQLVKRRVDLQGRTTRVHIDTGARVRRVRTSPRHDVLVLARSAVVGDLDFDGETDGIDLLRCTPLVGTSYKATTAVGLLNVDERFDPACDLDGDLQIDDKDIEALAGSFGTLRAAR